MLRVLPPRLEEGRAEAGFPEEGWGSSVAVAAVTVAWASSDTDRSAGAGEVRFSFVGMRLDRAKVLRVSISLAARMRKTLPDRCGVSRKRRLGETLLWSFFAV